MANQPHDNVRMLEMMQESDVPTVGMCMGDIGTPSRILCPKFGAPFTYATFHHERALAPGQLSYEQMVEIYRYDSINPETDVYGVIADPVGHSLSPQVHNAAFGEAGINAVYVPFRVPIDALGAVHGRRAAARHQGPERHHPAQGSDRQVAHQGRSGREGHRRGEHRAVQRRPGARLQHRLQGGDGLASRARSARIGTTPSPLQDKRVLVLGAGGVAGPCVRPRTPQGARRRSPAARARGPSSWPTSSAAGPSTGKPAITPQVDVIVNCTPIGMHPNVDETPFGKTYLKPTMVVFDTVYNPEIDAAAQGSRSCTAAARCTGVEMFIRQAALQFMLFTGRKRRTN